MLSSGEVDLSFEYPRRVSFRCERCASCCGDSKDKVRSILLLNSEAEHISRRTSIMADEFAGKIKGFEPYVYRMKKTDGDKCVFLKGNLCSIYRFRPLICRFYPFQVKLTNNKYVFTHTGECPGIGKGRNLKKGFFESLFKIFTQNM
ncbi:MAG: hypothetical protein GTN80_06835, partial [Nitrososphaeria archaeon]|nr:hypothetical protein [Nitrososphaeria archaeon]